jgi:hypothetical protein
MKYLISIWFNRLFNHSVLWESGDALDDRYHTRVVYVSRRVGELTVSYNDIIFFRRYVVLSKNKDVNETVWEQLSCYAIMMCEKRMI